MTELNEELLLGVAEREGMEVERAKRDPQTADTEVGSSLWLQKSGFVSS